MTTSCSTGAATAVRAGTSWRPSFGSGASRRRSGSADRRPRRRVGRPRRRRLGQLPERRRRPGGALALRSACLSCSSVGPCGRSCSSARPSSGVHARLRTRRRPSRRRRTTCEGPAGPDDPHGGEGPGPLLNECSEATIQWALPQLVPVRPAASPRDPVARRARRVRGGSARQGGGPRLDAGGGVGAPRRQGAGDRQRNAPAVPVAAARAGGRLAATWRTRAGWVSRVSSAPPAPSSQHPGRLHRWDEPPPRRWQLPRGHLRTSEEPSSGRPSITRDTADRDDPRRGKESAASGNKLRGVRRGWCWFDLGQRGAPTGGPDAADRRGQVRRRSRRDRHAPSGNRPVARRPRHHPLGRHRRRRRRCQV